jgi:hypothetical protein
MIKRREDEVGECSMRGDMRNNINVWSDNLKERNDFGDIGAGWRITLKWVLKV